MSAISVACCYIGYMECGHLIERTRDRNGGYTRRYQEVLYLESEYTSTIRHNWKSVTTETLYANFGATALYLDTRPKATVMFITQVG